MVFFSSCKETQTQKLSLKTIHILIRLNFEKEWIPLKVCVDSIFLLSTTGVSTVAASISLRGTTLLLISLCNHYFTSLVNLFNHEDNMYTLINEDKNLSLT